MFGYVKICKEQLSAESFEIFRSYYCGLCHAMGRRCSQPSRLGLSYDITFLAVVLSSIGSGGTLAHRRCLPHIGRKSPVRENDAAVDYAADMGVILSYLKLSDDWHDDRSIKALFSMLIFYGGVRKARKRHPATYARVYELLERLTALENSQCGSIDETADCFAKILEELFTPPFVTDEHCRRPLAWLGYNIGRWIYILDAYNDLERDHKRKSYNPLLCTAEAHGKSATEIKSYFRERLSDSLTFTLENAASAYELLTVEKNKEIIDNILYTALIGIQNDILGEEDGSVQSIGH